MITLKNSRVQAWIIVFLVWLGAFIASYAQNQLSGMSVQFMEHYGFTAEQYASIYSASQFLGIWLAFVTGILSDKIGTRKIIILAGLAVSIACTWRIFATTYETQYIANMLSGFTGLFIAVNRAKILGGWFPPSMIAIAVGIVSTTTPVANTVGIGLTSLMPSVEFAFGVTAAVSIFFLIMWFLFGKERSDEIAAIEDEQPKGNLWKNLLEVLKSPWAWAICAGAFFIMACQVPIMAFYPMALQMGGAGLDAVAAGGMVTGVTIGMGVGSVVTPFFVKLTKAYRPIIAIYAIIVAAGAYFGWQMPAGPLMYAVLFIVGFCLGGLLAMPWTFPIMIFGHEKAASAQGLIQTFVLAGASLALTNITIPLAGAPTNFGNLYMIAAIYVIIAGVALFIVPDQGKKAAGVEK